MDNDKMTREEILAQMKQDFDHMPQWYKNKPVVNINGQMLTPAQIWEEVQKGSEAGEQFVQTFTLETQRQKEAGVDLNDYGNALEQEDPSVN